MINGKQKIKKDDWRTPDWLFKQLNAIFNFTLDIAATSSNSKCINFTSDAFSTSWQGERVFCNPPFSKKNLWIKEAHKRVSSGECPIVVMILPNCIDTKIFNDLIDKNYHWEHVPHRVSFCDDNDKPINGNPSGTIIVYFKKQIRK